MNDKEFSVLFKKYYTQLCTFSYKYVRNTQDAEDIVEDVFCRLYEKKDEIFIKDSLRSFLYRCAANKSLDYLKSATNKQEILENCLNASSLDFFVNQMIINRSEKEYDYNLLVETVNATVDSLPQQTRCVFRMSRDENLTNKQIAEKLNISVKTVEKHMTRALSTLRAKMVEYNFLSLAIFLLLEKIITHIK